MAAGDEEEVLLADDGAGRRPPTTWRSGAPAPGADDELLAEDDEAMLVEDEPAPCPTPGRDEPLDRTRRAASATRCSSPLRPTADGYGDAMPYEDEPAERTQLTETLGAYEPSVESAVELPPDEELVLTPARRRSPRRAPAPPTRRARTAGGPQRARTGRRRLDRLAPPRPRHGRARAHRRLRPSRAHAGLHRPPPARRPSARPSSAKPWRRTGAVHPSARRPLAADARPRAAEVPPEESGPVAEECNEASFFLDQGLLDEAREMLETVELVRPGLPRTAALRERLAALEAATGGRSRPTPTPPPAPRAAPAGRRAHPVAHRLVQPRRGAGRRARASSASTGGRARARGGGDDFQYSVEEVFSEFKKGLEKVVQARATSTPTTTWASPTRRWACWTTRSAEFEVARQGCLGQAEGGRLPDDDRPPRRG